MCDFAAGLYDAFKFAPNLLFKPHLFREDDLRRGAAVAGFPLPVRALPVVLFFAYSNNRPACHPPYNNEKVNCLFGA